VMFYLSVVLIAFVKKAKAPAGAGAAH